MLNRLKLWVLETLLNKYCLGWVVTGWKKALGYKTQIGFAVMALVCVLNLMGVIDDATRDNILLAVGGVTGANLVDKLRRNEKAIGIIRKKVEDASNKAEFDPQP